MYCVLEQQGCWKCFFKSFDLCTFKTVGSHSGGYDSFWFDITDYLLDSDNELLIWVYDPSDDGYQPNGKQVFSQV